MTTKYGMLIQAEKCLGCDICVRACKDEFIGNDYPGYSAAQPNTAFGVSPATWPMQGSTLTLTVTHGQNWMDSSEVTTGAIPNLKTRYIVEPCLQCDNAPCVTASTGNAVYTRPDGIVIIDPQKVVGQSKLPASCPYGRIYWNSSTNIAQKCTFCAHLIDKGQNPRCVDSCPLGVILFGDLNDPNSAVSKQIAATNAQPLHPEYGTKPKVYYTGLI